MWRDIVGYEGLYQVSDDGEIRSLDRKTTGRRNRIIKGRTLKQGVEAFNHGQYLRKTVTLCKDGVTKSYKVHRLVAEAFVPNPRRFPVINHIDLDPTNNAASNLEWCTQSYNMTHANANGHRTGPAPMRTRRNYL